MEQGGQLDLLEHVVAVVRGHPVGAQGHVHPGFQQAGHGGHAGGQLQVGHGVVDGGDAPADHALHVVLADPHAVGGQTAVLPHAIVIQHGEGGLAPVAGHAL